MTTTFPLARYRFEWQATSRIRLPDYAGSMLRGAFGHALRQLSCMTRQKECTGCPLLTTCPYTAIFAPAPPASHTLQKFTQIPVPYIIEPPDWGQRQLETGDTFYFDLVLIGRALVELPLIVLAWRRALLRGIGAGDGKAELLRLQLSGPEESLEEIHTPSSGQIRPHLQKISLDATFADAIAPTATTETITLRIDTPMRLQHNGRALPPEQLDARTLLMALVRRGNLLAEFHGPGPLTRDFAALSAAATDIQSDKQLRWRDWTRYSSRQQQKMALGGVVGAWTLRGKLAPFIPYLKLGEWLHAGKEAAFGMGRYKIVGEHTSGEKQNHRDEALQVVERKEEVA